jgi:hypothetical protein
MILHTAVSYQTALKESVVESKKNANLAAEQVESIKTALTGR